MTDNPLKTLDDAMQAAIDTRNWPEAYARAIELVDISPTSNIRRMYMGYVDSLRPKARAYARWPWLVSRTVFRKGDRVEG